MKLKRRSVTKLASLSALGAGAVVFSVQEADAGIILTPVNKVVGFDGADLSSWQSVPIHIAGATSSGARVSFSRSSSGTYSRGIKARHSSGTLVWAGKNSKLQIFAAGKNWGNKSASSSTLKVAVRNWHTSTTTSVTGCPTNCVTHTNVNKNHSISGNNAFSNMYALFKFGNAGNIGFGWVKLSLSITDAAGTGKGLGPELTIISYAFDDSGAFINSGDTGKTSGVPEPGTLSTTGLAALALGAAGLRRWRATRVKAQSPVSA